MTTSRFGWGIAALCSIAVISPAIAETFIMTDGSRVEGTIVRSFGNTISVKYEGAGMLQVPIGSVQLVEIPTKDGGVLSGKLLRWSDGVYQLSTDQGPVQASVEDGVVIALVGEEGDSSGSQAVASPSTAPVEQPETGAIKAGFVYVGPADDGGRTFMREKGRQALAAHPKIDDTTFLEIDVEDNDRVIGAVEQLVVDGANMVFMTGNDSAVAVNESAKRHGAVRFVHCGSFDPAVNVEVVCGRIYQARYLSGMIAGGMTVSDLIGYVAAKPVPEVLVGINAFALGVQSVNPDAEVIVHWTNSWYAPGVAQQRAEELIERGVDVLTIHQDSPAALQVAERYGVDAIGFQSDMSAFAPSSILTSAIWNWGAMYDQVIDQVDDGNRQLRPSWLGLREGVVGLAPIASRVPDDVQRLVRQRQREIVEGRFDVFTGPIRDVDGDLRIRDGRVMTDENLQTMDYLVEGVIGF